MGRDKVENEDLIAFGLPEDVWFHVEGLSSAHVYVRLPEGLTIEDIDAETLEDCAQLVKANSIQGNKQNNIDVVYTPWSNLKKIHVEKRINDIVNRLNKSKREEYPDLKAARAAYDAAKRAERKAGLQDQKRQEKKEKEAKAAEKELRSYGALMQDDAMTSNKQLASKYASVEEMEDDFM